MTRRLALWPLLASLALWGCRCGPAPGHGASSGSGAGTSAGTTGGSGSPTSNGASSGSSGSTISSGSTASGSTGSIGESSSASSTGAASTASSTGGTATGSTGSTTSAGPTGSTGSSGATSGPATSSASSGTTGASASSGAGTTSAGPTSGASSASGTTGASTSSGSSTASSASSGTTGGVGTTASGTTGGTHGSASSTSGTGGSGCTQVAGWSGDVNLPWTDLTVTVTIDGAAPPAQAQAGDLEVYLVNQTTNVVQYIGGPTYHYNSGPAYDLDSGSDHFTTRVISGTYDVMLRRNYSWTSNGSEAFVYRTETGDTLPNGDTVLQRGLVLAPGAQSLSLDVPTSTVNFTVTIDGAAPPAQAQAGDLEVYLVNQSTGVVQYVGGPTYHYNSGPAYDLDPGSDHFSSKLVAGTYDVLVRRNYSWTSNGSEAFVYRTETGDTLPNGDAFLQRGVTIAQGTQSLAVDIATTNLSSLVTIDGAAPPAQAQAGDVEIYLVNQTTNVVQYIGGPTYHYNSGPSYDLDPGSDHVTTKVFAGSYAVLMRRNYSWTSNGSEAFVYRTETSDALPNGDAILRRRVTLPAGPYSLPIDVPTSTVNFTVTIDGAAPPAQAQAGDLEVYLVNQSTGVVQYVGGPTYHYNSGPAYDLDPGSDHFSSKLVAGKYDVLVRRNYSWTSNGSEAFVYRTETGDTLPNGDAILQRGVTIASGAQTLAVDLPTTDLSTVVTIRGAPPPATAQAGDLELYLRNQSTGIIQYIGGPTYHYNSGPAYDLDPGSDQPTTKVFAGTYDLLLRRNYSWTSNGSEAFVYRTETGDTLPNADAVLLTGLAFTPGPQSLAADIPATTLYGVVTVNGGPAPATAQAGDVELYAINRTTGVVQYLGGPTYHYNSGPTYDLDPGSDTYSTLLVSGTYDVLVRRNYSWTSNGSEAFVYRSETGDTLPNGDAILGTCLYVP